MGLINLNDISTLELAPGVSAQVVTADTLTVAHVSIKQGSILPEHAHFHEQVVNVTEGELELTVEGKPYVLKAGKVMVLAPNIPHSGKALSDCKIVDVFHPIREDFRAASFGGYDGKK
ncbi:MAG: cupin domain-containing protein [candidate division Zixibacteria bacterium]|nr:cupin domain-containing protein [candidate division Zixibacteria bacterium]